MTSVKNENDMQALGQRLGGLLRGGEIIELIGDVGAGKTTFTKGVGRGLRIEDDVQSPSFTISRVYAASDDLELHHYDFYRLEDAGVLRFELAESINDPHAMTIIEWAGTVQDVLPDERCIITINYTPDGEGREVSVMIPDSYKHLKGVV